MIEDLHPGQVGNPYCSSVPPEQTKKRSKFPLIIGGASRSGTNLMLQILDKACTAYAIPTAEGWLGPYLTGWPLEMDRKTAQTFVFAYMNHERGVRSGKELKRKPLNFSFGNLDDCLEMVSDNSTSSDLLDNILTKYAQSRGAISWGVKDTYAEITYEYLKKKFPDCKFLIMIRDPRASLCSELYFGTFPERNFQNDTSLKYRLLLWYLSASTATKLTRKYPSDVKIVQYEDLVDRPGEVSEQLSTFLNTPVDSLDGVDFSFRKSSSYEVKNDSLYNTKEKWKALLTKEEIWLIEKVAGKLMGVFGYSKFLKDAKGNFLSIPFLAYARFIFVLSSRFPSGALNIVELFHSPFNALKKLAKKLLILGVQLGFLEPSCLARGWIKNRHLISEKIKP